MDGIHAMVSARVEGDLILVTLQWVATKDGVIQPRVQTEQVRIGTSRPDVGYLSRAVFTSGAFVPGTFWVDENGHRHFVLEAEAGVIDMFGKGAKCD